MQENQRIDRFVIYDPLYLKLRNVLVDAVHGEQIEELAGSCQVRETKMLKNCAISFFFLVLRISLSMSQYLCCWLSMRWSLRVICIISHPNRFQ